ncbi:hypothetical protein SCORR_v1c04750 [Spiroplasma corruscae]|uniref:Transposase n=1 Tax=Spiroplasma corruscae TaxID=216934 RepID=A0A222EP30_9MOLU|nr:UPF0236 family protein [Spiroplasma corruscae]ASP28247.1 hypothetical protein SCORR_v1c04750 [Spiroplasma corruscae]
MKDYYVKNDSFPFLAFDQVNLFHLKKEDYLKRLREDIVSKFEDKDLEIKTSKWRKNQGYYADGTFKRRLLTSVGLIIFKKTRYKFIDPETKKWRRTFLVDDYLQIEKYSKWSHELKSHVINLLSQGSSKYADIDKAIPEARLHKSTISRFVKKLRLEAFNEEYLENHYNAPKKIEKYNTLYISIDDSYVNLKTNNKAAKYQVRVATLCLGKSDKPDSRNSTLIHKRVITWTKKCKSIANNFVNETIEDLNKYIKIFYGKTNFNYVICGDGANWIKSIASSFGGKIVLDKFHLVKEIAKIYPPKMYSQYNKQLFNCCINALTHGVNTLVDNYLIPLSKVDDDKIDKIKKLIRYIKNNKNGIESYKKDYYIGCFTESNIYHYVKAIANSKSYNFKVFHNLINLRLAYINNLDPIFLWKDYFVEAIENNMFNQYLPYKVIKTYGKEFNIPMLNNKSTSYKELIKVLQNKE